MPDISFFLDKEPEEIVRWYESKGLKTSYNWRDIWQGAQVKAFTVAKAMDLDILQDIKSEVVEAIKKGNTYEEFRKNLEPRLKAKGWWGKQDMVNPNTGEMETVQLGSPWRLKTIYRTNVSVAYSAGRYKKFLENAEDRPFWQYNAVLDKRTRPLHALLDGKVFRYDDPFWQTHFPPNDWGCRCSVTALNKRDIDREGLKVENNSGEWLSKVPAGEGWNYNPGEVIYNELFLWEKIKDLKDDNIARMAMSLMNKPELREKAHVSFASQVLLDREEKGRKEIVGWMDKDIYDRTGELLGKQLETPFIVLTDNGVVHFTRPKKNPLQLISNQDIQNIPSIISNPEAVYYDTQDPALLYLSTSVEKKIKIVIRVDYNLKKVNQPVNYIKTASLVSQRDLMHPRFIKIK